MPKIDFTNRTKVWALPRAVVENRLAVVDKVLRLPNAPSVSLVLLSPVMMRRLNRDYRHKDKVTDVLSFIIDEDDLPGENILGEIFICPARADRQAKELGHSYQREMERLALHGYLHLLGFDHEKEADAVLMEKLEAVIMAETLKKNK